jgi:hypothetical protein
MHLWPILLVVLVVALVAALLYVEGVLIRDLSKHPWQD